jgi:hypothetical protein
MIKKLTLNEDHLKLINMIRFQSDGKDKVYISRENPYILFGHLCDLALVLGLKDKEIPGTEEDPDGAAYPDDVENYILSIHHYIVDNLYDIEVLIHQMALQGGITPGTYKCIDSEEIWSKEK